MSAALDHLQDETPIERSSARTRSSAAAPPNGTRRQFSGGDVEIAGRDLREVVGECGGALRHERERDQLAVCSTAGR